jgi:TolB-like protein
VVDAVECAVAVQAVMAQRNEGVPVDRQMLFRIGVNLGDILIEGDDILGDGVNVAARLEGIAEPAGICISSSAYDQVRGKVAVEFTDLGEQTLKNIARPVRAYAVGLSANAHQAASLPSSAPRLSMVVLPFANIGSDPEQEYFVDGVTDSLTTDLSRITGALVIARNTAFTFKGKAVDVKKIGRELNVSYVLEGSVQRSGKRLRVNVQLIDAQSGNHLWADRFDKTVADIFDMQDEIVSRLANALDAQLTFVEARRAEHTPHPDALDLYFQGLASAYKGVSPEHFTQARRFFAQGLALDPGNANLLMGIGAVDLGIGLNSMVDDRAARLASAETMLKKAVSLAPDNALAHAYYGLLLTATDRAAQGIAECERALTLDRNLALAHAYIGYAKYLLGRAAETEAHVNEALRLSPRDIYSFSWFMFIGQAKFQLGEYGEAVEWFRKSHELNRNYPTAHFHRAAALALLGRLDEAKAAARESLAQNPGFTIRLFLSVTTSNNPAYLNGRERLCEGMRLAGMPEG